MNESAYLTMVSLFDKDFLIGICLFLFAIFFLPLFLFRKEETKEDEPLSTDELRQEMKNILEYSIQNVNTTISGIPDKVLKSISSSTNVKKGALGELVGYLELKATYDRIIPLGNIVDFVGIKFPTETEEGHVDFIDIKTGKSARLSKDQKALQQLIQNKNINFIKIKVESETFS